jgi:hypothetical protein
MLSAGSAVVRAQQIITKGQRVLARDSQTNTLALRCPTPAKTRKQRIFGQFNLVTPDGHAQPTGVAQVLTNRQGVAIKIVARGVQANRKTDSYAAWLYNSPTDTRLLGFVNPGVGSDGKLSTAGVLPADAGCFQRLILSLETGPRPNRPHRITLTGQLPFG